jgi:hemolysin-activating ACP:hemolysin acyltransferase
MLNEKSDSELHSSSIEPDDSTNQIAPTEPSASKSAESEARAGLLAKRIGEVVSILVHVPRYRHLALQDIEWIVIALLLQDHLAVFTAIRKEGQGSQLAGALMWAKVSPNVDRKIREQIRSGVFPVRLKPDEWSSGDIVWLLDVIAPTKSLATRLVADVGCNRFGDAPVAHPLLKELIDSKALRDLGAEPAQDKSGEREASNQ